MKGIKVDGSFLNHLRFADNIVLFSSDIHELEEIIRELNLASKHVGLKMNIQKTKIMSGENVAITIDQQQIENVSHYIYLGHNITLGKDNQRSEVARRVSLMWAAFGNLAHILKNPDILINLKRKIFDSCILPVATYGMETITSITLTVNSSNKLSTEGNGTCYAQYIIERQNQEQGNQGENQGQGCNGGIMFLLRKFYHYI